MFAVAVTFTLEPGQEAAFLDLIVENAAASLSGEPGCHRYDVCRDPDDPATIFLYEVYADAEAFDVHRNMEHFQRFDRDSAAMIADKRVRTYEIVPTGPQAG